MKLESLAAIVVVIGAENGCLNFTRAGRTEGGAGMGGEVGGTLVVRGIGRRRLGLYLQGDKRRLVRSIIGATEKRRDSGAGMAVIGGIGIWSRWGWDIASLLGLSRRGSDES